MAQQQHRTLFSEVAFEEQKSLLIITWLPHTAQMNEEEHIIENLMQIAMAGKYKPRLYLVDFRDFSYDMTGKDAEEKVLEGNLLLDLGIEKMAVLSRQDISELSVLQQFRERTQKRINETVLRFFTDEQEALNWLKEN